MSTPSITPDQSSDAPNVQMPASPAPSNLGQAVSQMPTLNEGGDQNNDFPRTPSGGSRLLQILGAVAKVGSTALAGVPDKGRPSFVTGLGEGARGAQAAEATQQAIKFRSFDDSVRAAQLHHQDQELQLRTQEQQEAHQKFQDFQHDWNEAHGIDDTIVPNVGDAVVDHLTAQTSATGAASIPAGTHLSADGTSIHVPTDTQATRDGQLQQYNTFAPIYGLPSLPEGAKFVPSKFMDALTATQQGYAINGTPLNHDLLTDKIAALQAQRSQLTSNGKATPDQLTSLDNTIGILNANQKALDDHQADVFKKSQAQQLDTLNKSEAIKAKYAEQKQDNAAADKPQKPQNTDSNGNPVWVPGVSADEKKKAELSENVVFNGNNIASILARRPDLVGPGAGRFTTLAQMAGTNDPDITALQQDMHNIAMANVGIHGMKANEAVQAVEKNILNNFRNGPKAIGGALKSTADSVQTFIDTARPNTYKTHSKNGGAMRSMVPQAGQQ